MSRSIIHPSRGYRHERRS